MSNESPPEEYSILFSTHFPQRSAEIIEMQCKKRMMSGHNTLINYHNYAAYIKVKLSPRMGTN